MTRLDSEAEKLQEDVKEIQYFLQFYRQLRVTICVCVTKSVWLINARMSLATSLISGIFFCLPWRLFFFLPSYFSLTLNAESLWLTIKFQLGNFLEDFIIITFNQYCKKDCQHLWLSSQQTEKQEIGKDTKNSDPAQKCMCVLLRWPRRNLTPAMVPAHTGDAWQCSNTSSTAVQSRSRNCSTHLEHSSPHPLLPSQHATKPQVTNIPCWLPEVPAAARLIS